MSAYHQPVYQEYTYVYSKLLGICLDLPGQAAQLGDFSPLDDQYIAQRVYIKQLGSLYRVYIDSAYVCIPFTSKEPPSSMVCSFIRFNHFEGMTHAVGHLTTRRGDVAQPQLNSAAVRAWVRGICGFVLVKFENNIQQP